MVVLTGSLTRLAPYITATEKKYLAVVKFGSETDTLELSGKVVATAPLPRVEQIEAVLKDFCGKIQQVPPLYSAIHIEGRRASDVVRSGATLNIPSRQVEVFSLEILDYLEEGYGLFQVHCSKGTYIRSLARDIANALGSKAHLVALRRTAVGNFNIDDAIGIQRLGDFSVSSRGIPDIPVAEKPFYAEIKNPFEQDLLAEIEGGLKPFLPNVTSSCGLGTLYLNPERQKDFQNGKPLQKEWFVPVADETHSLAFDTYDEYAVFLPDKTFLGVVKTQQNRMKYGFVIPSEACFGK